MERKQKNSQRIVGPTPGRALGALRLRWAPAASLFLWFLVAACQSNAESVEREAALAPTERFEVRAAARRPNVIVILLDDVRADVFGCSGHPFSKTPGIDSLAADGVQFRNAFVAISLCSPSRATILSGCRPQRTGVFGNRGRELDERVESFPEAFQRAGYRTAFMGKWHMAPGIEARRGFDHWLSFSGQGVYQDPNLWENGERVERTGYMTDLLNDGAVEWLSERNSEEPFLLYLSHKAVHVPFKPAERHRHDYADQDVTPPKSWLDDLSGKPSYMISERLERMSLGAWKPLPGEDLPDRIPTEVTAREIVLAKEKMRDYLRCLRSVDEGVGRILDTLRESGLAQDTLVLLTSDNGLMIGEHFMGGVKQLAYEESIRVPLIVSYPAGFEGPVVREELISVLDIAPTLLELCGIESDSRMQGMSLAPLLSAKPKGLVQWRDDIYYEHFFDRRWRWRPHLQALRTERWKLIQSPMYPGELELYDLVQDPEELHNLAYDPAHEDVLQALDLRLQERVAQAEALRLPELNK